MTLTTAANSPAVPPEPYVDASTAGEFLGIHPRTIQRLAREGALPAHPFGGTLRKTWRFKLTELDEWLRSRVNSARRPCSATGRIQ